MNTNKIYEQTMDALTDFVTTHHCPEGEPSIRNFCRTYKIGRQNLTASLAKKPGHDMSVGVFLRVCLHLGLLKDSGLTPEGQSFRSSISLRQYMEIDNTALRGAILGVNLS